MSDYPAPAQPAIKPETFDQEVVYIRIGYDEEGSVNALEVFPEEAVIHYHTKRRGGSRKARQVRWVARNLADGDRVAIRPKGSQPEAVKRLFNPGERGEFEVTHQENSIVSGHPGLPDFSGQPVAALRWDYDVVVKRSGKQIGFNDPSIVILKDG